MFMYIFYPNNKNFRKKWNIREFIPPWREVELKNLYGRIIFRCWEGLNKSLPLSVNYVQISMYNVHISLFPAPIWNKYLQKFASIWEYLLDSYIREDTLVDGPLRGLEPLEKNCMLKKKKKKKKNQTK